MLISWFSDNFNFLNLQCVLCLRLLKKFDPKDFQPKTLPCGYDELDSVYDGKKGQINEQVVELSIGQQIYDMVDAGGVKGMTINEVQWYASKSIVVTFYL